MGAIMHTRAARLVEPRKIEIIDDSFELGPLDVAVKIAVCGICSWENGFYTGQRETELPRVIGHEPSGIVEAVGAEVSQWKPGDRVTGVFFPGFATYARVAQTGLIRVPDHVPLDHALVVGCGFMGLLCVAGLRSPGLGSLVAVDTLDERLELARQLGATHCLNPRRDDVLAELKDITSGHGVDVAMEASTVPAGFELASKALKRGRPKLVVVTTALPGATYDVHDLMAAGAEVHFAEPAHCLDQMDELRRAMDGIARGVFPMDKLITHRYGLNEIGAGMDAAVARTPGFIKGIVVPNPT